GGHRAIGFDVEDENRSAPVGGERGPRNDVDRAVRTVVSDGSGTPLLRQRRVLFLVLPTAQFCPPHAFLVPGCFPSAVYGKQCQPRDERDTRDHEPDPSRYTHSVRVASTPLVPRSPPRVALIEGHFYIKVPLSWRALP